jgi:hypothetical protein
MKDSNSGEDLDICVKKHEEIIKEIQEIIEFENRNKEYDLSESDIKEELIEVDNQLEEFTETIPKIEEEPKIRKKIIVRRTKVKQTTKKELNPTVFHLRLNEEGKLENLDIKKPEVKERKNRNFRLKRNKKDKGKSKFSIFKDGFDRIKKAIPSTTKETEEIEESEE